MERCHFSTPTRLALLFVAILVSLYPINASDTISGEDSKKIENGSEILSSEGNERNETFSANYNSSFSGSSVFKNDSSLLIKNNSFANDTQVIYSPEAEEMGSSKKNISVSGNYTSNISLISMPGEKSSTTSKLRENNISENNTKTTTPSTKLNETSDAEVSSNSSGISVTENTLSRPSHSAPAGGDAPKHMQPGGKGKLSSAPSNDTNIAGDPTKNAPSGRKKIELENADSNVMNNTFNKEERRTNNSTNSSSNLSGKENSPSGSAGELSGGQNAVRNTQWSGKNNSEKIPIHTNGANGLDGFEKTDPKQTNLSKGNEAKVQSISTNSSQNGNDIPTDNNKKHKKSGSESIGPSLQHPTPSHKNDSQYTESLQHSDENSASKSGKDICVFAPAFTFLAMQVLFQRHLI